MSIGTAFLLPDGVLLVADGRTSSPLADLPPTDDTDKVIPISNRIFAIPFGIVHSTRYALRKLRLTISEIKSPEALLNEVDLAVKEGWQDLMNRVAEDVDINHGSMKAGLVVAGLLGHSYFIIGSLHGTNVNQEPVLIKDKKHGIVVVGGEEQAALSAIKARLEHVINTVPWNAQQGPANLFVRKSVSVVSNVIREVSQLNSSIGGVIRYAVIREGYPFKKSVVEYY